MAFEFIENSIRSNAGASSVSADDYVGFLSALTKDVFAKNKIQQIEALQIGESEKFARALYSVMSAVSALYAAKRDDLRQCSDLLKNRFQTLSVSIEGQVNTLAELNDDIGKIEREQEREAKSLEMIEASRGHLRAVRQDITRIQQEIAFLSDAKLDELLLEKERLGADLAERTHKRQEAVNAAEKLADEISAAKKVYTALREEIKNLNTEIHSLSVQIEQNKAEKAGLEASVSEQEQKTAAYKVWLEGFTERAKAHREEYDKLESIVTTYVQIWTSEKNQLFLQENLLNTDAVNALFNVTDYRGADEWFTHMEAALKSLLNEYRSKLSSINEMSMALTK